MAQSSPPPLPDSDTKGSAHCCCDSYEVTRSSNTIWVQLQMRKYTFQIKILSKDTPSFQRWDWLKIWKTQGGWNTIQYEQNHMWWMWVRWTMISKMNEVEMTGFDNYHKITIHDHVRVPKLRGQIPKNISGVIPFT